MSLAVASRYARALADIVSEGKADASADEVLAQLRAFQALQQSSVELRNILASPAVPVRKKRAAAGRHLLLHGFLEVRAQILAHLLAHALHPAHHALRIAFVEIAHGRRVGE